MNARPRGEPLRERGMPSSHRPQQRCGRVREMRPSCRGATIDGSSRKVLQEASASSSCENRTGRICLVVTPPWRRLCIRTWSLRVVRHHFEAQSRLMPQGEERDKLAQTDGLIHYGRSEMCDYSLHNVASRAAKLGDKLVVTDFAQTITRGFAVRRTRCSRLRTPWHRIGVRGPRPIPPRLKSFRNGARESQSCSVSATQS